jgi:hypothetical protein
MHDADLRDGHDNRMGNIRSARHQVDQGVRICRRQRAAANPEIVTLRGGETGASTRSCGVRSCRIEYACGRSPFL